MNQFEEKESKEFSLIGFFAVTGFCFFLFSFAIKLLDGFSLSVFNKIGLACICLAGVCLLIKWLFEKEERSASDSSIIQDE